MHTYPAAVPRRDHLRDFCLWFLGTSFALALLPALPLLVTNPSRQEFADYYTEEVSRHYPTARQTEHFQSVMENGKYFLALRVETLNFGIGTIFIPPALGDHAVILGMAHCFIPLYQPSYPPPAS